MTAAEFGALAPAELSDLIDAWRRREQREDYRFGVLAALLVNINRDPKKSFPAFPADFFPSLEALRPELDPDEIWARATAAIDGNQPKG